MRYYPANGELITKEEAEKTGQVINIPSAEKTKSSLSKHLLIGGALGLLLILILD